VNQTAAQVDEDLRCALKALSADAQASLALGRATLQAIAALTPAANAAANAALTHEIELARRLGAAPGVVSLIENVQARLDELGDEMAGGLERALIAAADALPDIQNLEAVEAAILARA
jgi:hypothetical protein